MHNITHSLHVIMLQSGTATVVAQGGVQCRRQVQEGVCHVCRAGQHVDTVFLVCIDALRH